MVASVSNRWLQVYRHKRHERINSNSVVISLSGSLHSPVAKQFLAHSAVKIAASCNYCILVNFKVKKK